MPSFEPGWDALPAPLLAMWTERHLCTLTTLRADGSPHVVPVGVALDPERECAWVITDGGRWSTLEGTAVVTSDPADVARAVERYAARYRQPAENPARVALRISVDRFLFGPGLLRD